MITCIKPNQHAVVYQLWHIKYLRKSCAVNFPIGFRDQNIVVKHKNQTVDTILSPATKNINTSLYFCDRFDIKNFIYTGYYWQYTVISIFRGLNWKIFLKMRKGWKE